MAMWARIQISSSPGHNSTTPRHHRVVHEHPRTPRQSPRITPDGPDLSRVDRENLARSVNSLGISQIGASDRYTAQRAKLVPRHQHPDVILQSSQTNDCRAVHSDINPTRQSPRWSPQTAAQRKNSSSCRPASPIYSRGDEEVVVTTPMPQSQVAPNVSFGGWSAEQISPPSSPGSNTAGDNLAIDEVSPIDNESDTLRGDNVSDTRNLPSQQQRAAASGQRFGRSGPRPGHDETKTPSPAERSGHQAMAHVGSGPGSDLVAPREPAMAAHRRPSWGATIDAAWQGSVGRRRASASATPSFGQRMLLMGRSKPARIETRPRPLASQGSSSLSSVMDPAHDELKVAPLNLPPQKNGKKPRHADLLSTAPFPGSATGTSASASGNANFNSVRKFLPLASKHEARSASAQTAAEQLLQQQQKQQQQPQSRDAQQSYPSPPAAAAAAAPRHHDSASPPGTGTVSSCGGSPPPLKWYNYSPTSWSESAKHSTPSPSPFHHHHQQIRRKPPPTSAHCSPLVVNCLASSPCPSSSDGTRESAAAFSPSPAQADAFDAEWVPPPSRFSITTYATSTSPGTPRQFGEEEEDEEPQDQEHAPPPPLSPPPAQATMDHGRPFGARISSGSSGLSGSSASKSINFDSKPLPPAPMELSSKDDPVSTLNAQLSGLYLRKLNVERSIKQMTQLMPQHHLYANQDVLRKREEEKNKVDRLKSELAEIQIQEHDLGMKLYYANKRQYRNAEFEPTGLWVSRAAGY